MKVNALLKGRLLMAVSVGACLVLATFIAAATACLADEGSLSADTASSNPYRKLPDHLVLHGVRFDLTTGQLDDRSKALLDYAVELLKGNPEMIVAVVQNGEDDPNSACGLSLDQTQIVASYIERRGVPAARLRLCQATPAHERHSALIPAVVFHSDDRALFVETARSNLQNAGIN
jgi:hypothetical protein